MFLVAERLDVSHLSKTRTTMVRAELLRGHDTDVITIRQDISDFDTPAAVRESCIGTMRDGRSKYPLAAGINPQREAIRKRLNRDHGPDCGINQITAWCGLLASPRIHVAHASSREDLPRACGRSIAACAALS
ncbi:hypothetical protein FDV58_34135 [Bradyrhizobium elkanii]|uniref:Uncharacterized protein n=1 Tax=Bradyrhizobium elkanii TaxID=29448 RepID=A0A4U6RHZ1_BRAEL|nr:hypothetical protein [Bradyrhizobium elkanii]TKV74044.1 hypothetical protein FDV58_34135 [Bradyrhizobium elkanii]